MHMLRSHLQPSPFQSWLVCFKTVGLIHNWWNVLARFETGLVDRLETGSERVDGFKTSWDKVDSNAIVTGQLIHQFWNWLGRTPTQYWPASQLANLYTHRLNSWLCYLERVLCCFLVLYEWNSKCASGHHVKFCTIYLSYRTSSQLWNQPADFETGLPVWSHL